MNIGIIGLGLIGGSLARAFKELGEHMIFAYDKDPGVIMASKLNGVTDGVLSEETIGECDYIILSLYPKDTVEYIKENAKHIKKGTVVIDTCGIKRNVCAEIWELSDKYGFIFIGGHPMAGTQFSGFSHSRASLFKNASMIMCIKGQVSQLDIIEQTKQLFLSIGFGSVIFTTPEFHDEQIAFTSQLPHIISNAYIKSPAALCHKGFSAGSYKDLSRVARLNTEMWSQLFLDNKDNLLNELDSFIENIKKYSDALKKEDKEKLKELLAEGVEYKLASEKRT